MKKLLAIAAMSCLLCSSSIKLNGVFIKWCNAILNSNAVGRVFPGGTGVAPIGNDTYTGLRCWFDKRDEGTSAEIYDPHTNKLLGTLKGVKPGQGTATGIMFLFPVSDTKKFDFCMAADEHKSGWFSHAANVLEIKDPSLTSILIKVTYKGKSHELTVDIAHPDENLLIMPTADDKLVVYSTAKPLATASCFDSTILDGAARKGTGKLPGGSYSQSCKDCVYDTFTDTLECKCRKSGSWEASTSIPLKNVSKCLPNSISNENGYLSCRSTTAPITFINPTHHRITVSITLQDDSSPQTIILNPPSPDTHMSSQEFNASGKAITSIKWVSEDNSIKGESSHKDLEDQTNLGIFRITPTGYTVGQQAQEIAKQSEFVTIANGTTKPLNIVLMSDTIIRLLELQPHATQKIIYSGLPQKLTWMSKDGEVAGETVWQHSGHITIGYGKLAFDDKPLELAQKMIHNVSDKMITITIVTSAGDTMRTELKPETKINLSYNAHTPVTSLIWEAEDRSFSGKLKKNQLSKNNVIIEAAHAVAHN